VPKTSRELLRMALMSVVDEMASEVPAPTTSTSVSARISRGSPADPIMVFLYLPLMFRGLLCSMRKMWGNSAPFIEFGREKRTTAESGFPRRTH
jgi:hypothetical protein